MEAPTKVEILRASCCVAGASGETSEVERVILNRLAKEIGVGQASLNAMVDRAESDPDFHKEQFKILKAEPTETLAILFQVAMSDGNLSDEEIGVLKNLSLNLDVPEEIFEKVKTAAASSLG